MKFTVKKETISKSLSHISSVVERKNTMPILSNVKIETIDGNLMLTATDMDLSVIDEIEADIKAQGETTIPAHLLYDVIKKLPANSDISFSLKENGTISITCGRSRFSLPCISTQDFPVMGVDSFDVKFTIDSVSLRLMIDKVKFAMSTEETRYYLNGVYLHVIDDKLKTVATDGHRLAIMGIAIINGAENLNGIIIPRKAINEIRKLIDSGNDNVLVSISKAKIQICYQNITLISKLIDGTFPDYSKIIPKENNNEVIVNTRGFVKSIDLASVTSSQERKIKITINGGNMEISSTGSDEGTQSIDEIEIEHNGDDLIIGFNSIFIKDVLSVIDGENATLMFKDNNSPVLILDENIPGSTFIVMPMRVN